MLSGRTMAGNGRLLARMVAVLSLAAAICLVEASPRKKMVTLQDYLQKASAEEQKWHKIELQLAAAEHGGGDKGDAALKAKSGDMHALQEFRRAEGRLAAKHAQLQQAFKPSQHAAKGKEP
eukprot:CAMPEP_0196753900 /NCGR_PEP_ID=MMETSP1091-20130531/92122_1 /TAXON_ID=302021 /ORGANISM="Rhodomonas sp., Strain CCMP768" /LENGTH=120 /DNA_ID=CAMNT_0042102081 /DNA_START=1 /DNA_END=359 /DNA_ORIENTATION=+